MATKVFQTSISKITKTTPFALGGLLHAFTSKFNAIHGFSLELIEGLPDGKHKELKEKLLQSLDSFKAMLEQLQFFSKHQMVHHEQFQLGHLIEGVCRDLKKKLPNFDVDLQITQGQNLIIYSDKVLWQKALMPIIQNGWESYPQDSSDKKVLMQASRSADQLMLVIQDHGQGIASEILPDIFVPFFTTKGAYRLSGKGADRGGTLVHHGLGLTLSTQIVDTLGGHFEVTSVVGRGTEIRLVFKENFVA